MSAGPLLKSKVCVITGGGRGIGAGIAERFAQEGADLILTARSEDQLQEVMTRLHCTHWVDRVAFGNLKSQGCCRNHFLTSSTIPFVLHAKDKLAMLISSAVYDRLSFHLGTPLLTVVLSHDQCMQQKILSQGLAHIQVLCDLKVANSCKAKGASSCETHSVDLSQSDDVESFAKAVLSKHKQVDVLVNNAGMGAPGKNSPLEGECPAYNLASLSGHTSVCVMQSTPYQQVCVALCCVACK